VIADISTAKRRQEIRAKAAALALRSTCREEGHDPWRLKPLKHSAGSRIVNNAAIFINIQRHPFSRFPRGGTNFGGNIKGPFLCARAVFAQMKEQKSGKIVNISSSTAYWGTPNFLHYVASKAALIGMTRSLAREVGEFGICVMLLPRVGRHEG
jgi:3-oxoacyl-[acyl-carrier protein] reductase